MTEEKLLEKRIIEAAKTELREKGLLGVSMRLIAARAGIAVGTIYNYVSSKEELIHHVLISSWQKLESSMRELIEENLSFRLKLVQVARLQLDFMSYHNKIWWDFFMMKDDPVYSHTGTSLRSQTYGLYLQLLEQIISNAREKGEILRQFETVTNRDLATAFVMLINSLKPIWYNHEPIPGSHHQNNTDLAQFKEKVLHEMIDIFLYGLFHS